MAAFFLADFLVGFFLAALFAARLELVLAPPDLRAAAFFFAGLRPAAFFPAGLRAACLRPRALVVRPAAVRPAFFFTLPAALDRLAAFFLAAFFRADFFAIVPSFVG
ncbi:MAG TPA: hypothetical protein VHP37_12735 [Burkholderiales bacterium]|nr:hypothetical protein [Burkholderiales bacterium]